MNTYKAVYTRTPGLRGLNTTGALDQDIKNVHEIVSASDDKGFSDNDGRRKYFPWQLFLPDYSPANGTEH